MTIKSSQDRVALEALLKQLEALPSHQNPIKQAMRKLRNVHFARFVFLSEDKLAVITTYDGSLESYIDAFVNEIGAVFDQLLTHMQHAPPLPVAQHRQAFLQYVQRHDVAVGSFFSAYPALGVQDILLQERNSSGPGPEPHD